MAFMLSMLGAKSGLGLVKPCQTLSKRLIRIKCDQMEQVIGVDLGGRGITELVQEVKGTNQLYEAASALYSTSGRILIVTGFFVLRTQCGENDGPPGAIIMYVNASQCCSSGGNALQQLALQCVTTKKTDIRGSNERTNEQCIALLATRVPMHCNNSESR
jgi:hypothetical protein